MERDSLIFQRIEDGEDAFILRIYQWKPAALSLGAHQDAATIDSELAHRMGINVVRRLTGGGAILHDRELTYSYAAPRGFFTDPSVQATLRLSTSALKSFYARWGLKADLAEDIQPEGVYGIRTAACFAGKERWDLQIGGRKIGGNAQKRGRRAIFQHGSLPLELDWDLVCRLTRTQPSVEVPTSLAEECRKSTMTLPDEDILCNALAEEFISAFGLHSSEQGAKT